jgi:hypothetical protein
MGTAHHAVERSLSQTAKRSNDRRAACRYPVRLPDALLGWWSGSDFVNFPARIVDLSTAGCRAEARALPSRREKEAIWVRPLAITSGEWTAGIIVSRKKPFLGKDQIRIKFLAPFPYESFQMLVYGPAEAVQDPDSERPEHEREGFWR